MTHSKANDVRSTSDDDGTNWKLGADPSTTTKRIINLFAPTFCFRLSTQNKMKFSAIVSTLLVGSAAAFAPTSNPSVTTTALHLAVGQTAPDFSLLDQNGKKVSRSGIKKPLVVYFYPADATPGCTVQAQTFDSRIQEIRKEFGAEVVGISGQDVQSKQKFAADLGLSFSILADEGDAVRKAFGVPKAVFGLLPGRVTYVLDQNGVCQMVYDDLVNAASHVDAAANKLKEMKPAAKKSFFG
jgi:thioredoxin-dependent peroxiredoxin